VARRSQFELFRPSLSLLVALVALCSLTPRNTHAAGFPNGPFRICNLGTGGCLAPSANGILTLSWAPPVTPWDSVLWEQLYAGKSGGNSYYFLINRDSGMCMDVVNGAYHDGAQFKVQACCSVCTSMWWGQKDSGGAANSTKIRNLPSGKCITSPYIEGSVQMVWNGNPPVQYTCGNHNQHNQYWFYPTY
jgi:hypothetical protein